MNTIKAIIFFRKIVNLTGYTVDHYNMSTSELQSDFYFTHPHCIRETGLNEATNGLLRL